MSRTAQFSIVLLISILMPRFAGAEDADFGKLQAFTQGNFYRQLINQTFAKLPQVVFKRCPAFVSNGSQITILTPVSYAASGFPIAGSWKHRFPVSGCGNDTIWTLYATAEADEKVNIVIAAPGTTAADLTLQRDAYRYATLQAGLIANDCKSSFLVMNTKFEGFGLASPKMNDPGEGQPHRPWRETWTMIGCSRQIDVPLNFIPDDKGTQIMRPGAIER